MSKVLIEDSILFDIGGAIRSKNGSNTGYKSSQMPAAIMDIPSGITPTGTVNITQNGITNVTQYASASVNVPNSYSAGDEGKVVSNGELVAQTARSSEITTNGIYDTTLNNEVTVNVSGGGGTEPILPSIYQEVEYIGFDGNQFMLVENVPTDCVLQVLALNTVSKSESAPVGYREASNNNADFEVRFQNGSLNLWVRSGSYATTFIPAYPTGSAVNVIREIFVKLINQSRNKFLIGKYNTESTDISFYGKLYRVRILASIQVAGQLTKFIVLQDFVPCYRKSDGEIGLYELYTETFYTNEGTGTFTKGNDVT